MNPFSCHQPDARGRRGSSSSRSPQTVPQRLLERLRDYQMRCTPVAATSEMTQVDERLAKFALLPNQA